MRSSESAAPVAANTAAPLPPSPLPVVLAQLAQDWVQHDPNPITSAHVRNLLERALHSSSSSAEEAETAVAELSTMFPTDDPNRRIGFGTAGLRAAMCPGPLAMNDLTVMQAAQGIAAYCQTRRQQQSQSQSQQAKDQQETVIAATSTRRNVVAVVGYDHRAHSEWQLSSHRFALLTKLVFDQAGLECALLDGYVATPLVPFAVQQTNAMVGIMVTASHNPKNDAGYKVYWRDQDETHCCQIRPPLDAHISNSILQNLQPWTDYGALLEQCARQHPPSDLCHGLSRPTWTHQTIDAYFQAVANSGLVTGSAAATVLASDRLPKFCYTAMHGVGHAFAVRVFETFQLSPFVSVPSQQEPDPNFPTVTFPNPEEPGALNAAMQHALQNNCPIVVANDPDADRLAVAEYNSNESGRGWTSFTGDQIGAMLGHWLWNKLGKCPNGTNDGKRRPIAMVASAVSSQMLATIARTEHFHCEDALTGFKWIGYRAAQLQLHHGYQSLFCYEEAIGFCCGNVVFDKDGLTALGVLAELVCDVYSRGSTLSQHLQGLYDQYGEFVSRNGYYVVTNPSQVQDLLASLAVRLRRERSGAAEAPSSRSIAGYDVSSVRYLGDPGGYDDDGSDELPSLPTSKSSPMLTVRFSNGCVVHLRGSGTEPKFKYYMELRGQAGVQRSKVESDLIEMSDRVLEDLLQSGLRNGLLLRPPGAS